MKLISIVLTIAILCSLLSCSKATEPQSNALQAPVFNPSGGTYAIDRTVTMSCRTAGAEIRYTIDGSEPDSISSLYGSPLVIGGILPAFSNSITLKAKSFKAGFDPSTTRTAVYTVSYTNTVVAPQISPSSGSIESGSKITMTCATDSVHIYYTLDGSEPTVFSLLYIASFSIEQEGEKTVKAKAFKANWNPSTIVTGSFIVIQPAPEMILIPGGTFNNGTSDVTVASFYIGKNELTQQDFKSVMGTWNEDPYGWGSAGIGDSYPVYYVSWFDAIEYCNRRSINENITPCYSYDSYGTNPAHWPADWKSDSNNHSQVSCDWTANGYRLPTEAEWQFAARGGNASHNYRYSGSNNIDVVAWNDANSYDKPDSCYRAHPVRTKIANELGLYDMSGNVWEWNWDISGSYSDVAETNPHGAASGAYRVNRGGSWNNYAYICSVSYRYGNDAIYTNANIGFRLCRNSN